MKRNKKAVSGNYLDYIPVHNEKYKYSIDDSGNVIIFIENTGLFNRIAQKCFKKPEVSQIHLDEMGNFIWPLIDGKRSILDISKLVHEEFGEKAEPLYNRLVQYIRNLESYEFIKVMKTE